MDNRLDQYLRGDRAWTRQCRIDHARLRLSQSTLPDERKFWLAVLEANAAHAQGFIAGDMECADVCGPEGPNALPLVKPDTAAPDAAS